MKTQNARSDDHKMTTYEHYSLFGEAWWLDAVAGAHQWDEVRVESGGRLQARLPFVPKSKFGIRMLGMPPLTQCLGPWIAQGDGKYATELAREQELVEALLAQLPKHDIFRQNFHHAITNWLPWYWQDYRQTTRYTYVLANLSDQEQVWQEMQSNIRREIRKAEDRHKLEVRHDLGVDVLIQTCQKTFERQGIAGPSEVIIRRIVEACQARNCGQAFFAVDEMKQVHAALFTVWDERTTYYLLGGGDPELRNSGAHSLLMWKAIQHATTVSKSFDFEGSMIQPVERFFRAFGARQIPYHHVWGGKGRLARAGLNLRQALKELR
jgi:lipid II:glycine glycyltransferase (peptidoglycan interpeptide bridge formation enzyme)